MTISENIARIREQIHAAARRANRSADEVTLMGVTKTVEPQGVREAYEAGIRVFGENRVQEFANKVQNLLDVQDAEWHMIGHLQTNKTSKAAEFFEHVDSIDSLRLARRLNSAAAELKKKVAVLIEINIGGEPAKSGVTPGSDELELLLNAAPELAHIEIRGLMTIPPYNDDAEQSRPHFRKMRTLFEQIASRKLPKVSVETLSMGMSHDFEIAIEEGATCVRVGTAIFGERPVARSKD
jgi:PLP dependent protein